MLSKAQELAKAGFHVFPLKAGAKEPPLIREFQNEATRDPVRIKSWWKRWPDANIGISTSRFGRDQALVVIDVDDKGKQNGSLSLDALELVEDCVVPATFTVRTPTGGRHLYLVAPAAVRQGTSVLGAGLDIRSRGGYVVGPGSVVPGGKYQVENAGVVSGFQLAAAPQWVTDRCGQDAGRDTPNTAQPRVGVDRELAAQRAREYLARRDHVEAGARNDEGYRVAARLRDFGVEYADAADILEREWKCTPPLDRSELDHVVDSAYRYARGQAGADAPETYFPVVTPEEAAAPVEAPASPLKLLRHSPGSQPPSLKLVKGVLRSAGLSLWVADPDAGKTTVLQDVALHIAHGTPWMGRKVTSAPVLYACFERTSDVQGRLDAFYATHPELAKDADSAPFFYVDLESSVVADKKTVAAIEATCAHIKATTGQAVGLIVVDTLSAALHGDENSSEAVGELMRALKHIKGATGAHVACAHHLGKNKTAGARGHSKLVGDFDSVFALESGAITPVKLKASKKWKLYYSIEEVSIGRDEDGDVITSVALKQAAGPVASDGSADQKVIDLLRTCEPAEVPDDLALQGVDACVKKSDWLTVAAGAAPEGNKTPRKWASNTIGRVLKVGMNGLKSADGYVWSDSADGTMLFGEPEGAG